MRDLELTPFLRNYKPLDTLEYLRDRDWILQDEVPDRYAVFTKRVNGDEFEVQLPMSPALRDLERRVRELLETLHAEEERPMDQIVEDLSLPNMDIVRTRIGIDSQYDGTLPMEDGTNAFREVRNLFLAAACSAVEPRAFYTKRKFQRAMDYVRGARLGQTQRGSYVITVYSPVQVQVPPVSQPTLDLDMEDVVRVPFGRRTVSILNEALLLANDGIATMAKGRPYDIDALVQHGVSANLCEAVTALNVYGGGTGLEVSTTWSRALKASSKIQHTHRFSSDAGTWLSKLAANVKKKSDTWEEVLVRGAVRMLDSDKPKKHGKIKIIGTVEDQNATVEVSLDGSIYQEAINAHKAERQVELTGDLKKKGKVWQLSKPRDFKVVG
ncbi:MAG TPA: hypothetical protein PL070_13590 [Flavobacteriales bacterium]|nr:hypothetical protein [Flavobacteriales bacterium]